jgi:hypothetical protein
LLVGAEWLVVEAERLCVFLPLLGIELSKWNCWAAELFFLKFHHIYHIYLYLYYGISYILYKCHIYFSWTSLGLIGPNGSH